MRYIKLFEDFNTAPAEELRWEPLDWNLPIKQGVYSFNLNDEYTWEKWSGEFDLEHLNKLKDYLDTEKLCERIYMSLEKSHISPSYYEYAKNGGNSTLLTLPVIKLIRGKSEATNELLYADFEGQERPPLRVVSDWDNDPCFHNTDLIIEGLESGIYQINDLQKYIPQIIDLGIPKRFLGIIERYKDHLAPGAETKRKEHAEKGKALVDRIALFNEAEQAWREEYAPFESKMKKFYEIINRNENPLIAPNGTLEERGRRAKNVLARAERSTEPYIEDLRILVRKFNRLYPELNLSLQGWGKKAGLFNMAQHAGLFKRYWEREGVIFDGKEGAIFDDILDEYK